MKITIEPTSSPKLVERGFAVTVYEHGTYGKSSVLAGQLFKQNCGSFHNAQEALLIYPDAEVLEHNTGQPYTFVPDVPPPDFDPLDAGEVWSEEDY